MTVECRSPILLRKMQVSQLIQIWKSAGIWLSGQDDLVFDQILSDTRKLGAANQALFFARRGTLYDGHNFLKLAAASPNVKALVVETDTSSENLKKPVYRVKDTTLAMALASKEFFSDPSSKIFCTAITGTNGKTTSAFLLRHTLDFLKIPTAISGTIESGFADDLSSTELTTPDFLDWQALLSRAILKGAKAFAFEASSHALKQSRLLGIELDAAVFTNLSPEHLDYHQSMENYFQAKKILFSEVLVQSSKAEKLVILPEDRAYGSRLAEELKVIPSLRVIRWGYSDIQQGLDLKIEAFESSIQGLKIQLNWKGESFQIYSPLIGKFNVENIAGVACVLLAKNFSADDVKRAIESFAGVPGRLERVKGSQNIFVDYAHTPDALENVLSSLRPMCKGKLMVVFGCGGNRDVSKRPKMTEVVELYADEFVITSDNPRNENPNLIIEQMLKGLQRVKKFHIEGDRRKAIEFAIAQMKEGDVLVIAGKGHEKFQEIENKKIDFDDVEIAREYVR